MEFPTNINLEPCPFCKDTAGLWIQVYKACDAYLARVKCKYCSLRIDIEDFFENEEEAICAAHDWWNNHLKHLTK